MDVQYSNLFALLANKLAFLFLLDQQPDKDVATATILVPQQALESLIPKPPDRKDNKNQEPPRELGTLQSLICLFLPVKSLIT